MTQSWYSPPSTPFDTLPTSSRNLRAISLPPNWEASAVSSRSCSPIPKCVLPPVSKISNRGASNGPSYSIQEFWTIPRGASSSRSRSTTRATGRSALLRRRLNDVAVKAIVVAVNAQYVEQLEEYYVGYKTKTIRRWSSSSRRGI